MATLGTNIIDPALRKAGIKRLCGSGSSTDQNTEMILAVNRVLDLQNIRGHMIFGTRVEEFSLVADQISYTIGSGGDFNTVRPNWIKNANLVIPGDPPTYQTIPIYDSRDWSLEQITAMPGSWVYAIWYNALAVEVSGPCGRIYLLGQPPANYKLQLFTWNQMKSNFSAVSDGFVFPPGYEACIVNLLALECAELYPHEAKVTDTLRNSAAAAQLDVEILNSSLPRLANDMSRVGQPSIPYPASFWNAN